MRHRQLVDECEALGMTVRQEPADRCKKFSAAYHTPGVRVYWSTSYEGTVLGLPRVISDGVDRHARSIKEVRWLVRRELMLDWGYDPSAVARATREIV